MARHRPFLVFLIRRMLSFYEGQDILPEAAFSGRIVQSSHLAYERHANLAFAAFTSSRRA